ncbi:wall-associated receptor kinase 2-like [Eucalyptus grandis]|uniref:wall-associated receptor kinase 2-like n=1 Tax=Eucalyptus grandis TaxID=71139 RepID=UPI00192ECF8D|nr:wall-associated receptor kinase 2-like [Eucalyptus grandis]
MALALATFAVKDNCDRTCGNMSVPFPFGLDESCARNSYLVLSCNHTSGDLSLEDDIPVLDISLENGTMTIGQYRAFDCYDESGHLLDDSVPDTSITLGEDGQYTFSDTRNKLTVFGCDTLAFILGANGTAGSGCFSYCHEDINFTAESYCSGYGCCQTSIPKSLRSLNISMISATNYTSVYNFSSCGSAFLVDQDSFNVSKYELPVPDDMLVKKYSNVVLDWVVERDLTCKEAQSNRSIYACGANSFCSDFRNGQGYRCFCDVGYTGNPYASPLSPGCQDIDECKDPRRYPCHGNCKNTPGNYTCDCPFGMTGDGKVSCQISGLATTAAEILKHQRVKIFTEAQLAKVTNNYDTCNKLGEGGFASVYKGRIDGDILVTVKKPRDVLVNKPKDMNKDLSLSTHNEFLHEISIVSRVNHKNLVKLLEIDHSTLVEELPRGCLEVALALEYLHSLADPPIIHSDVKSLNILLDEKYSAKVSDFGASVLMSPGKTHIADKVQGTIGYLDPEYLITGELTTKSDVYSFGVVLLELLTREMPTQRAKYGEKINTIQSFISAMENRTLIHMTKFEASNEAELREIESVGSLGRRCLNFNGIERPTMREVAKQLARINKNLWADQWDDKETQSLLTR